MDVLWRFILFDSCVCILLLPSMAIWMVALRPGPRRPQRIAGTSPLREGRKGPLRMTSGIQGLGACVRCSPFAALETSSLRRR